ncbi:dTMP kinase [Rhodoglobus vestalii]|uniref:Thymidylate kinase n=1 Tax=Rhodoglobus vestalii TaxID=193384 RepID=A0A8H2K892_9MICO|nr:dTMP kinase [Rhodoglobus vestalii]TQO20673.1 dTMP kinase [Rhodoglobus vestalii]
MSRGLFITLEGGDGAGKTTQASHIAGYLLELGGEVLRTREPGGTDVGAEIRAIVLGSKGFLEPRAEALLFAADRAQHISTLVEPALATGTHVVQDRYFDSSVAYQGAGRALDPELIRGLSLWAAGDLIPDLTVLLDLEPELAAARAAADGKPDRIEGEAHEFRVELRQEFLNIAAREPQRFLIVDASLPEFDIKQIIFNRVHRLVHAR